MGWGGVGVELGGKDRGMKCQTQRALRETWLSSFGTPADGERAATSGDAVASCCTTSSARRLVTHQLWQLVSVVRQELVVRAMHCAGVCGWRGTA